MTTSARSIERRFLAMRATRWLPAGLLIPVYVLLLVDRGFTLAELGLVFFAQGLVVFLLELPTGGLADSVGRRPVLLVGTALDAVALMVLCIATSNAVLVVVAVLMGVYRALESGPLEAWYVDSVRAVDPDADIESGLARSGVSTAVAIAVGATLSSAIVALDPLPAFNALVVPAAVAAVLRVVDCAVIFGLMTEHRDRERPARVRDTIAAAPRVIGETRRLVTGSRVLAALIAVEFFWGFGMTTFETLVPPRLAELVDMPETAAQLLGPTVTVAWAASAFGAWSAPRLARRAGRAQAAIVLHVAQAAAVITMALVGGPAAVIVFYLLTLGAHGAINPLYAAMLHDQADDAHRTTVLSAASMATHPGFAIGSIVLGFTASQWSISAAMVLGAGALLITVPLYRPALRQQRDQQTRRSKQAQPA